MIYQENAMQVLAYAGIPIAKTYEIIKNIAKKRVEKVKKYKDQFIVGMKKKLIDDEKIGSEEAKKIALMTWKIIDDSSFYSFNASHSYCMAGDSLYGAYLKSHYPLEFYEVFLNILEEDGDKDRLSEVKIEAQEAYNIKFPLLKFGQDNRKIVANVATKEINQSMQILKGFGNTIGEKFYNLSLQFAGNDFLELLVFAEENGYMSAKWDTLIKINYFDKFGNNGKLYEIYKEFVDGENKYQKTYIEKTKIKRLEFLKEMWNNLSNKKIPFDQQLKNEFELLGTIQSFYPELNKKYKEEKFPTKYYYVKDLDLKFAPRLQCYNLAKGTQGSIKMYKKTYYNNPFNAGSIIRLKQGWYEAKENQTMNAENKWVPAGTGSTYFINRFELVKPEELDKILEGV
jgi:DNA polymerase III alpha subunit